MRIAVVKVGNSRGIRLPKPVLEQCKIGDALDLIVRPGVLTLKVIPGKKRVPRAGWAEAFRKYHESGEDKLIMPDYIDAEVKDWEW